MNEILLRRKSKIYIEESTNLICDNADLIVAISQDINNLGYVFSKDLFEALSKKDINYIVNFNNELIGCLKNHVGANVTYKPMYKNFPEDVKNSPEVILKLNAFLHYYSGGLLYPYLEENERLPLDETVLLKEINLCASEETELTQIFVNLLSSKTSISEQDKEDVEVLFKNT